MPSHLQRVRIADVAKEANVSVTAVSFAFNNPRQLNPQTVARILEVARHMGYSPNPHARALLVKSVGVIGILVPQSLPSVFANPFFASFYEGVGQVCEENGLSLLTVSPVGGSLSKAAAKAPVDGLIVVGLSEFHDDIEVLHKRKMPFVIVDGDARLAPSVNVDDAEGAFQAADFLLRNGHRNIMFMTFEIDLSASHSKIHGVGKRRLDGYRRAFTQYDIPWSDERLIPTATSMTAGAENFTTAWKSSKWRNTTGVLAVSDAIALGVLRAANGLGLRVPDDISVVGYDDIPLAALSQPSLTTIRQPGFEKGETAAHLLINLIAGDLNLPPQISLSTSLVIRQSAGPVPHSNKGGEADLPEVQQPES